MSGDAPGREALAKIDAILGARPRKDDDLISAAAEWLATWREALIPLSDTATGRDRLERLNAVLTIVLAVHYPQGATPWAELEAARGWLEELLEERP